MTRGKSIERASSTLKRVGQVPLADLHEKGCVRLMYPPFHVLVCLVDGYVYAIEDACNHAGASLSKGSIEGPCVTCPLHGYVFDVRTGELLIPEGLCDAQRTFVVDVVGPTVTVWDPVRLMIQ